MQRIYIAGAYSADNVITILDNIREGMRLATKVLLLRYSPFCPWLDFHFQLMLRGDEKLTVEDYYTYSIAWLEVSDAMLLVPGWQNSKGTKDEMEIAYKMDIPILYDIIELINLKSGGCYETINYNFNIGNDSRLYTDDCKKTNRAYTDPACFGASK